MKERFLEKMYAEYQAYRTSALSCPSAEIFSRSHEIDAITNFYEILTEKAESLPDGVLEALLPHRYILSELYDLWLEKKENRYKEMKKHVEYEVEGLMKKHGGDITDGKQYQ